MVSRTHDDEGFSPNAIRILKARYYLKDEKGGFLDRSPSDLFRRVATFIAGAEKGGAERDRWAESFFKVMMDRDFLPNSPTLTGAGRGMCLSACFVLPIEDSMVSIFDTVKNAALVHKEGGGTGFDFSALRPRGSFVRKTQGIASGPVSFLRVIDAATEAVKQGGTRRGANIGILRIDHPDIEEFIAMKRDGRSVSNFNISVAVTDEFMRALKEDGEYAIRDPYKGRKAGTKKARDVFRLLVESAWAVGDPGLVFIDRINRRNPTRGLGPIRATNPCGEQPLHAYESCNLGSINVANFYRSRQARRLRPGALRRRRRDGRPVPRRRHRGQHLSPAADRRDDAGEPPHRPRGHGLGGPSPEDGAPLRFARGPGLRRRARRLHEGAGRTRRAGSSAASRAASPTSASPSSRGPTAGTPPS